MSEDFVTKEEYKTPNLSKKICEALKEQTDINDVLKNLIKKSLKEDVETQEIIKDIIYKGWKKYYLILIPIIIGLWNLFTYFFPKNPI